ncbi:MAG: hypothetical protein R3C19_15090 [Planctomycetaceae bacterium]
MKKLGRIGSLCMTLVVAGSVGFAPAQDPPVLTPIPEAPYGDIYSDGDVNGGAEIYSDAAPYGQIYSEPVAPLFQRVRYKDLREMAPCAVTKIIKVKDPCACKHDCDCCGPKCVYISICVPPCACESIQCRRDGNRVRYNYGEYKVDVRVRKGYIEVDYQD